MKNIRRLTALLLICPAITAAAGQKEGCTVRKSFSVNEGTWLTVSSRYGDITVISSPTDSITVCATVSIQQENSDLASKNIALIKLNVEKKGDTVAVSTLIDDKFFSATYRSGRRSFSVDYVINVPISANLSVKNAFGDITIDETSGSVNVSLSHGDLTGAGFTRGNVRPVSVLNLEYVKANISDVNWMIINAKHCQSVSIKRARALVLTTEFSKLSLDEAGSIVCKSRSDYYRIGSINNFVAESTYSAFDIGTLITRMHAVTMYGTVEIKDIKNGFNLLDLSGIHTPVDITTQKDNSYKCNISLVNTPLEFDLGSNPGIKKSISGNNITLSGIAGKNYETASEVKINLDKALLRLK